MSKLEELENEFKTLLQQKSELQETINKIEIQLIRLDAIYTYLKEEEKEDGKEDS